MKLLVCLLISGCLLNAEETKPRARWRTILYRSSIVALAAANAMDIGSSWGGRETTPFLRSTDGRFGARGASLKLGMLAGIVSTELWMTHKHQDADLIATTVNLSLAATMTKISMNNIAIKNAAGK